VKLTIFGFKIVFALSLYLHSTISATYQFRKASQQTHDVGSTLDIGCI